MNVAPVMVAAFMASLNVADTTVLTATKVAPFAGTVETTVGGGAVVKVHTKLAANAAPAGSFAPVVIVAVYRVLVARTSVGVNVAVEPAYVTTPTTGVAPGPFTVNVAAVSVAAFIGSLKVAEMSVLTGIAVARFAGTVDITVGAPVVKLQTKLTPRALPPGSFAPVVMVPVYIVFAASEAAGVNVAVVPA